MSWEIIPESEGKLKINPQGEIVRLEYIDSRGKKCAEKRVTSYSKDTNGYPYIHFKKGGKRVNRHIHRILAELFIEGRSEERNFVNHKNFNKEDFSLDNLEWVSCRENNIHSKNKHRKITESIANRILELREMGMTYKEISAQVGIHTNTIRSAIMSTSKNYSSLSIRKITPRERLNKEVETEILSEIGLLSVKEITKKYNINKSKYYRLKRSLK